MARDTANVLGEVGGDRMDIGLSIGTAVDPLVVLSTLLTPQILGTRSNSIPLQIKVKWRQYS